MRVVSARWCAGETERGCRSLVQNPKRRRVAALQIGWRLFGNNLPVVCGRLALRIRTWHPPLIIDDAGDAADGVLGGHAVAAAAGQDGEGDGAARGVDDTGIVAD